MLWCIENDTLKDNGLFQVFAVYIFLKLRPKQNIHPSNTQELLQKKSIDFLPYNTYSRVSIKYNTK